MEQHKIDRINELAKKKKAEGLSEEEHREHRSLQQEYVASFRRSLQQTLDNTWIVDEHGNKTKLQKKGGKGDRT